MDLTKARITVTGGHGFLGSRVVAELERSGVPRDNIFVPRSRGPQGQPLMDLRMADRALAATRHQHLVIHCAGNVGGIGKNRDMPGTLFWDNLKMGMELVEACRINKVPKTVVIGTICEYPKFAPVPFTEDDLWNGHPEETNAPYGIAKKALLTMGQAYRQQYGMNIIHLLPVNLYGPGDNFDPASSHVIPAMIRTVYEAKRDGAPGVTFWGTGTATREFLYVDDAAQAIVRAAGYYDLAEPLNIGTGSEISIKDLAGSICRLMEYGGAIAWDPTKPDGQPRRCLDVRLINWHLGWRAKTTLEDGLRRTIDAYLASVAIPVAPAAPAPTA